LLVLVAVAFAAGWRLLGPRERSVAPVAQVTPASTEAPTPSESATQGEVTETAPPSALATPAATPAATATPAESPAASPNAPAPSSSTTANAHGPKLALIVDDCGQWIDTERGFVALNVPLTMSVLPDVHYTGEIAREAAAAGKGVMLHLPMETLSGLYPGPGEITTKMTDAQIVAEVQDDLAQVPLARGVNNHEGSKASADERVMRDVIGVLSKQGDLFFIDSRTNPASVGEQVAQAQGVPTASRDVFLDNRADVAYTEAQLREAAAIAKRTGSAIAIGHPRPTTLEAVRAMIPELQASGIQFVLAQDLVSTNR
jgi:uncharacterized protein